MERSNFQIVLITSLAVKATQKKRRLDNSPHSGFCMLHGSATSSTVVRATSAPCGNSGNLTLTEPMRRDRSMRNSTKLNTLWRTPAVTNWVYIVFVRAAGQMGEM